MGKPSRRTASPNQARHSSSIGKSRNKGQQIIVGIIVAIGFCILLIGAIRAYEQYLIVKFWPAARGQVTNSQVTSVSDAGSPTRYQPEVEFRYRVRGMQFVSKTIAKSDAVDYPKAKRIANSYAPGSWHVVRYDPTDPADILANAGYTLDFFLWPVALTGVGLAFILIPLSTLIKLRASPKRRDPNQRMRLIGALLAVVGVGLIFAAAWLAYSTRTMLKTWPIADAQVMSSRTRSYVHRNQKRQKDFTRFEVIVEFRYPAAGQEYVTPSATDYTSSNEADQALALYAPGSRHEIRYNPADPNEIRFSMGSGLWLGCYICLGLGAFFLLFGATFLLVCRLERSEPRVE
jgi:hypothetical protein